MARLIDADRALEIVRDQGVAHQNAYHLTNYATLILLEAPTVDAVEVVRCKDCIKGFRRTEKSKLNIYWCDKWRNIMRDCDFCSYGERKEDADRLEETNG